MTTATATHYAELISLARRSGNLGSIAALVGWDQETYMPAGGAAARAEQSALIARIAHEDRTNATRGELIAKCEADSELMAEGTESAACIREMRRDYDLATKLPSDLVAALAQAQSETQEIWKQARTNDDYASFAPALDNVMNLTRQKAQCYGVPAGGELYDALLNEYEPGATAEEVESVFTPLGERLSALIADVAANGTPPKTDFLYRDIPTAMQHTFGRTVTAQFGFDYTKGRLDTTTHPFCSGFGPGDTRMTTRYEVDNFPDAIGSTMHECGHGLYEQGLPKDGEKFGTPLAEAVSLGIHESQSRMWENMVGRGRAFWSWALPVAKKTFGGVIDDVSLDAMVSGMNTCTPSFVRVESDEPTYNLHVMLRFGIERALMSGDLSVNDLPEAWNARFKELLGLDVPNNAQGCMQDVHWSFGLVGYFPTYTLGNLYAAQFWETINEQIPDLDEQMARGEFGALLAWCRTNIHQHGRRYSASELCKRATGKDLSADPLLRHLESRVKPAYGM